VQEAGDQCPALVGVGGRAGRSPEGWHEQRGAVVVFGGPAQEVSDRVAGGPVGEPGVDVALVALGHRDAAVLEPGEEPGGDQQLGAGVAGRGPSGCILCRAVAQPAQDPPGGVGVQQPAMLGLLDAGEQGGHPGFDAG